MKTNVGGPDRAIRGTISIMGFSLTAAGVVPGGADLVVLGISTILMLTALSGICPLYLIKGTDTLAWRESGH